MITGLEIKKLNKFTDERGWLVEIFRQDEINHIPLMAYVSVTRPGVVRGPHEHKEQSDCFVFLGPGEFELYLWDRREDSATKGESFRKIFGANNPAVIIVPPGVVHGYKCVSEQDGWCINLPDKLYKGKNKQEEIDEIRWENKDDSPFLIP